ncbi:hypothetical protein TNCV_2973441 [Trichonephila clavipes]|nr:hypothetical protein TNCV_2973441 [Trichonephila clavipes]
MRDVPPCLADELQPVNPLPPVYRRVAAIRDISHSCLDPNDFTVLNCIVKGHASLSPLAQQKAKKKKET